MNTAEARDLIAAYLSGTRRVPPIQLAEAHTALAADDSGSLRRLGETFLVDSNLVNECAIFRSRAAEFRGLTRAQRAAEMPDLIQHVASCSGCKRVYWDVQAIWQTRTGPVKVLSDMISVVLTAADNLMEQAFSVPAELAHAVQLSGERNAAPQKDWRLEDVERGCTIRVQLRSIRGGVELHCTRDGGESDTLEILDVRGRTFFSIAPRARPSHPCG